MKKHSKSSKPDPSLRDKIIGLGERSIRKSYYPQLQQQLANMEVVRTELAASEARYRSLIENINDVIFSLDINGIITYVSPVIFNLSGFSPKEITGRPFNEFIYPDDLHIVMSLFTELLAGSTGPQEYRVKVKNNGFCFVRSSSRPLYKNGKIIGLTGVMMDISEYKKSRKERQDNAERLQQFLIQTIGAIAATVEARDPYTAGHEQRVAQLAGILAERMGLSNKIVEGITLAASIHDLGKLRVPSEILSKPGQLTPLEYELIKIHPQAGFDIVKDIQFSEPIAQMILQHHERLDGSGYPQGLKEDSILLGSKILAVADVVEAMSSHRPYRPGLGIDAALQEISRHSGKVFDSRVVEHCISLFQDNQFSF